MRLDGIHHITAITGDARRNVDYYTRVLGLRLTAKTVNQDDPSVYHLFYGDDKGSPNIQEAEAAQNQAIKIAKSATIDAIQILGGAGFMQDHPAEMWMRNAAAME